MRKINIIKMLTLVGLLFLSACNTEKLEGHNKNMNIEYSESEDFSYQMNYLDSIPKGDLSDAEAAGSLFMREEEKLARDVYQTFFEQYELRIFRNISHSEDRHTRAVLRLINRYDLDDPVMDNGVGVFANQDLQDLYNSLIAKGSSNLVGALLVGAEIEEIDILDLRKYMEDIEENNDIMFVYRNLLRGSQNHLRAFIKVLKREGVDYKPLHLTQEDYDEIITSEHEKGQGHRGGGRHHGGRGNRGQHRGN